MRVYFECRLNSSTKSGSREAVTDEKLFVVFKTSCSSCYSFNYNVDALQRILKIVVAVL